jgi:hypothetical protein
VAGDGHGSGGGGGSTYYDTTNTNITFSTQNTEKYIDNNYLTLLNGLGFVEISAIN